MTNKIINWDSLNFSERLQFLKTIGWHETHHGWVDAYGIETWEAKDLATLHWAEMPERELEILNRWGIEK